MLGMVGFGRNFDQQLPMIKEKPELQTDSPKNPKNITFNDDIDLFKQLTRKETSEASKREKQSAALDFILQEDFPIRPPKKLSKQLEKDLQS